MRIKITIHAKSGNLVLPQNYQHQIQGFLYHNVDQNIAKNVHSHNGIKGIVFSLVYGKYVFDAQKKVITYPEQAYWYVSSTDSLFLISLVIHLYHNHDLVLADQEVILDCIDLIQNETEHDLVRIRTLSPITVHRSIEVGDSTSTVYYAPDEDEFVDLINNNFKKKYPSMITDHLPIAIKPVGKIKKAVFPFKGFVIVAYSGEFLLQGKKEYINYLLDTGLGDRNTQGFGMFEIIS